MVGIPAATSPTMGMGLEEGMDFMDEMDGMDFMDGSPSPVMSQFKSTFS